jgi:hypothetical protein
MKAKTWIKPKLIVLFKGRPEEAVLQFCKRTGITGQGVANCGTGQYQTPCQNSNPNPS